MLVGGGGYCVKSADQYLGPYVWFTFTWLDLYSLQHTKLKYGGKNTHRYTKRRNKQVSTETGQKNIILWTHFVLIMYLRTHLQTFCEDLLCSSSRLLDNSLWCCLKLQMMLCSLFKNSSYSWSLAIAFQEKKWNHWHKAVEEDAGSFGWVVILKFYLI